MLRVGNKCFFVTMGYVFRLLMIEFLGCAYLGFSVARGLG